MQNRWANTFTLRERERERERERGREREEDQQFPASGEQHLR